MLFGSSSSLLMALAAFAGNAEAFWRMSCATINNGRMDSIVNPGKVSGHAHTFVGSSNIGINSTYDTLFGADCTSCEIQDDKSAYWSPQLYYQFANGSFIETPHDGAVLYYIGRGLNPNLTAYPPGFRMLSGDAGARSYNNITLTYGGDPNNSPRPIADRISFACLNPVAIKEQPWMWNTDCAYGLRAQLHFQSCWNGKDLYKTDNSHVAYLSAIDNGVCPPTHPVQFVHLFLETLYSVNNVPKEAGGRFVFSMGDPTGYGFHGDFQNGWDTAVLQDALDHCAGDELGDGDVQKCPALVKSQISNAHQECPPRLEPVGEQIHGLLTKLPGCINVVPGPWRANSSDMSCPTTVAPPIVTPTKDTVAIKIVTPVPGQPYGEPGWNYVGCSNDSTSARVLSGAYVENSTSMTWQYCQNYCASKGFRYGIDPANFFVAGLEYYDQCYCDHYLYNKPAFNETNKACVFGCNGDRSMKCGGYNAISVFQNPDIVPPPMPALQKTSGKYTFKSCLSENSSGGRLLRNASMSDSTVTIDTCAKFCLGKRFQWFGVEYGQECYCGDRLAAATGGGVSYPASECSMRCAGNEGKVQALCGNAGKLSVYYSNSL